jgi:hypothetical protein
VAPTAALEPVLDESALRVHQHPLNRLCVGVRISAPVTNNDWGQEAPVDGVSDGAWSSGWPRGRHSDVGRSFPWVRSGASDHELAALEVDHCDRCDVSRCDDGGAVDSGARLLPHGGHQPAGGDVALLAAVYDH